MPAANTTQTFWSRIDKSGGPEACWPWQGTLTKLRGSYGVFSLRCKRWPAHRLAYFLTKGEIGSLHVCHACDNPRCCNPAHLFLGTDADNTSDKVKKGRQARGEAHSISKLRAADVVEIKQRLLRGEIPPKIAREYRVSPWTIYSIANGRNWAHILVA